jgi:hypothetical protein
MSPQTRAPSPTLSAAQTLSKQGIPKNMTAIASKLAGVGYNTVQAGKW